MSFLAQIGDAGVDVQSLHLLQRLLLISDGTLTDVVEAAFLEPILLVKLAVSNGPASEPVEALDLGPGAPLMRRQILLQGETSGVNFVYAESLIAVDALPESFRYQLLNSNIPLGRLWTEHQLETRKEILKMWRQPAGELSRHFRGSADEPLLARSYRVFCGGKAIMMITEYFPESTD